MENPFEDYNLANQGKGIENDTEDIGDGFEVYKLELEGEINRLDLSQERNDVDSFSKLENIISELEKKMRADNNYSESTFNDLKNEATLYFEKKLEEETLDDNLVKDV